MATDVDQSCYGWSHEELTEQDNSQEISVSQMLDHGSISFGRFALEPLSWEKRSVFTHNRYLEELEKFRAPGLVAQKKAYFEEYYKRIRAMKALQENQHTEPPSYCGGSNCIAGQIGEEDQRVVPSYCGCGGSNGIAGQIGEEDQKVVPNESDGDEMVKAIDHGIETEVTLDIDGATALVEPDSPAKFSKDDKKGRSSQNSKQWKILDINLKNHEPITTSIEDSGQNDFRRVDNKQEPSGIGSESISRQIVEENQRIVGKESHVDELEYAIGPDREKASIEVPLGIDVETASLETDPPTMFSKDNKTCKNSGNSMQFQFLDRNSCDHEPITASIEDSKKHGFLSQDNVEIPKKSEKYVTHDTFYPGGSPKVLELKLNTEQKKVKQAVKGFKGIAFTSEVMGHSSPAGDLIKSELKNKSVTLMLAQALRDSSQKRNGKNYVCNVSHKQTVDRILSSKHASVASHGSNKEICSKVTPRPFCFATGKQASPRSDTKNILSSSSLPPKNISSKGISSRPGIPYVLKREKLESRRGHEEHGRKPFATDRQATHLKEGSASNVIRPLKARSVNLPPKGDTDVGTNYDRLTRNNEDGKRKLVEVANDEACLKEARGHGKPTIFCVFPRSQNSDNIKLAPSRIRDLSLNTKNSNSRLGDNSLDIRKPRPEKPRWR